MRDIFSQREHTNVDHAQEETLDITRLRENANQRAQRDALHVSATTADAPPERPTAADQEAETRAPSRTAAELRHGAATPRTAPRPQTRLSRRPRIPARRSTPGNPGARVPVHTCARMFTATFLKQPHAGNGPECSRKELKDKAGSVATGQTPSGQTGSEH